MRCFVHFPYCLAGKKINGLPADEYAPVSGLSGPACRETGPEATFL
jgi:hypothetical protein